MSLRTKRESSKAMTNTCPNWRGQHRKCMISKRSGRTWTICTNVVNSTQYVLGQDLFYGGLCSKSSLLVLRLKIGKLKCKSNETLISQSLTHISEKRVKCTKTAPPTKRRTTTSCTKIPLPSSRKKISSKKSRKRRVRYNFRPLERSSHQKMIFT